LPGGRFYTDPVYEHIVFLPGRRDEPNAIPVLDVYMDMDGDFMDRTVPDSGLYTQLGYWLCD
jgi:hypothetical protein